MGPYLVPAGTVVGTILFAVHNTRHNWEEPLVFRCEGGEHKAFGVQVRRGERKAVGVQVRRGRAQRRWCSGVTGESAKPLVFRCDGGERKAVGVQV